ATHAALEPEYGRWPIFEHCLPFDVQRYWDELDGVDWPVVWTAERDREVWASLRGER
ncbi:MAG TPA: MBL fold metallo-hydrolase, partial [Actinokineospora sp.]|nr:MBL fold metallo-hydrolase [Actinokineospora sp.]